ncbi:MAG: serine/threonine-protein kinase, partial [Candidatus Eisenbacteria bacterium]
MIGKTVSHYRVLEKLGEGGMGVVYKAEDTKLGRTVALKFLPPELTKDPEAKERFVREARAASSLAHPGICTIHEIDEAENRAFIAMEFVEGESLQAMIRRAPLGIDKAIDLSVEIAQGLQEAHERGIVHRDIKSANIMVTPKGRAKIMDFGLARSMGQTTLTKTGTTVGTIAYMSPEQARGEGVDHRADIWSLGVVLYEMITGRLPFKGDHEPAVIYSILNEDPDPVTAIRSGVPMELERIVGKLLAKDPAARYQHVEELPVDLRAVDLKAGAASGVRAVSAAHVADRSPPVRRRAVPLPLAASLIALAALVTGLGVRFLGSPPASLEPPTARVVMGFPENAKPDLATGSPEVVLSTDGRRLVHVAGVGGASHLCVRDLDRLETRILPETEG